MTTKAELEREYVTVNGIIKSPGKFEGEPIWAPYFYEAATTCGADVDLGPKWALKVEVFDRREFPGMLDDVYAVSLWETDNGFVYSNQLTREEYERLEGEA
jgi:hypothetical protein